ncbi:MAG: hypothetical protein ISN64_00295 [Rickettsia sp.]|nr:hypothetical protein [Rickettsia sp.]
MFYKDCPTQVILHLKRLGNDTNLPNTGKDKINLADRKYMLQYMLQKYLNSNPKITNTQKSVTSKLDTIDASVQNDHSEDTDKRNLADRKYWAQKYFPFLKQNIKNTPESDTSTLDTIEPFAPVPNYHLEDTDILGNGGQE